MSDPNRTYQRALTEKALKDFAVATVLTIAAETAKLFVRNLGKKT